MAYFEFNSAAPQSRTVRKLKEYLIEARDLAEDIQRQNAEMALVDMQAQFGVDIDLTEIQWETTINDIVTLLDGAAVLNLISKVGFTS